LKVVIELSIDRKGKSKGSSPPEGSSHPTSRECEEAIALAEAMLPSVGKNPQDYKLIEAENLRDRAGAYRGPQFWYLTFKARELIPSTPAEIGFGGEVFVEVDLAERRARVVGYGE